MRFPRPCNSLIVEHSETEDVSLKLTILLFFRKKYNALNRKELIILKSYTNYTDEVTKNLMGMCEVQIKIAQELLTQGDISSSVREELIDEIVAVVDLMSYIDSQHKKYMTQKVREKTKGIIKTLLTLRKMKKAL